MDDGLEDAGRCYFVVDDFSLALIVEDDGVDVETQTLGVDELANLPKGFFLSLLGSYYNGEEFGEE